MNVLTYTEIVLDNSFVKYDISNTTQRLQYANREILLWIVHIKSQKLNVGQLFKYDAKKTGDIINLSIQVSLKSTKGYF